jgi:hypothetical protein
MPGREVIFDRDHDVKACTSTMATFLCRIKMTPLLTVMRIVRQSQKHSKWFLVLQRRPVELGHFTFKLVDKEILLLIDSL